MKHLKIKKFHNQYLSFSGKLLEGLIITNGNQVNLIEIYLKEYEKLKDEQISRIGFRDNLLYVNLVAIGGVISYALSETDNYFALLVLPFICFVLGWTYLVNDEKISAIGRYLRTNYTSKLKEMVDESSLQMFGWEVAHRSDKRRVSRKIFQFIVDEITFVGSGLIVLIAIWMLMPKIPTEIYFISLIETVLLLILAIEIFIYADFKKGE
ncbi:MAG: hypothetical protein MIO93_14670 [ANME-2 cluster archaeon]|jgi:hypothetical protein|nr:hypothetical protein [ANME-2 cluster archaeon]